MDLSPIGPIDAGFIVRTIYPYRITLEGLLPMVPEFELARSAAGERGKKGLDGY